MLERENDHLVKITAEFLAHFLNNVKGNFF